MISLDQYWMGRDQQNAADLTPEIRANAETTVYRVNKLLELSKLRGSVSSGWRPPSVNAKVKGAAKKSKHMTGQACDLLDTDGDLDEWCMANQDKLMAIGLWLEHPEATKGWCHVQTVPPRSGRRVFRP